jgi:hypothetical protein
MRSESNLPRVDFSRVYQIHRFRSSGGFQAENGIKVEQPHRFQFGKLCVKVYINTRNGGEERNSLFAAHLFPEMKGARISMYNGKLYCGDTEQVLRISAKNFQVQTIKQHLIEEPAMLQNTQPTLENTERHVAGKNLSNNDITQMGSPKKQSFISRLFKKEK